MLINFKVKNYRALKNEVELSMIPDEKVEELQNSILNQKIEDASVEGLSTAVIYGHNSIGKTTLLASLGLLKQMFEKGGIPEETYPDYFLGSHFDYINGDLEINNLELLDEYSLPHYFAQHLTELEITFLQNSKIFKYKVAIDTGSSIVEEHKPTVKKEALWINNKLIFKRIDFKLDINYDNIISFVDDCNPEEIDQDLLEKTLLEEHLFLCRGFLNFVSKDMIEDIFNWFIQKTEIELEPQAQVYSPAQKRLPTEYLTCIEELQEILKPLRSPSSVIGYCMNPKDKDEDYMVSQLDTPEESMLIPSKELESTSLEKFVNFFPVFANALEIGSVILMDQLDMTIPHNILTSIINLFHDPEINKNGAQLIFTTYNPIYLLDENIRKDEIKFMDFTDKKNEIEIYSLADICKEGIEPIELYKEFLRKPLEDIDLKNLFLTTIENNSDY